MTLHATRARHTRSRGLSLVELMVALVVGLLLMAGTISIFLSNKRTYEITDDLSRLQENARFALETMLRDLRMAGNLGCGQRSVNLTTEVAVPSDGILWDLTTNLEGLDDGATAWSPSGRATSADNNVSGLRDVPVAPLAGTDAITLRYGAGPGLVMTAGQSVSGATIPVDTSDDAGDRTDDDAGAEHAALQQAQLAVLTDCGGMSLFQLSAVQAAAVVSSAGFSRPFERSATGPMYPRVMPVRAVRYFVGDGAIAIADEATRCRDDRGQPVPALYRTTLTTTHPEPVVCGVENMQILYGVDNDGDEQPNLYARASAVCNTVQWRNVVSVRLGLLLRTLDEYGADPDPRPVKNILKGGGFDTLEGCETDAGGADRGCVTVADPNLRVRRRVFSTTVFLRNRI